MILVCIYLYKIIPKQIFPLAHDGTHINICCWGVQDSANVGVLVYSLANQQHLLNQECFASNRLMNLLTTSGYLTIPGFCDGFFSLNLGIMPKKTHQVNTQHPNTLCFRYVFGVQLLCQEVFGCLILWIIISLTQSFSKTYPVWN